MRSVLSVGIEAVDAVLDLGEDAAGCIELAVSHECLYHLRYVLKDLASGAVNGGIQTASYKCKPWRALSWKWDMEQWQIRSTCI